MKINLKQIIIVFFLAFNLSGCVVISHKHSMAKGINNAEEIVIVKDSSTKEGFLIAIEDWMKRNDFNYTIVELDGSNKLSDYDWALDYKGVWRWDVSIFLDDAEIRAFRNGEEIGYAKYNVGFKGGLNLSKWRSAEKTIYRMLDNLFGK